jgi:hypothetical protein
LRARSSIRLPAAASAGIAVADPRLATSLWSAQKPEPHPTQPSSAAGLRSLTAEPLRLLRIGEGSGRFAPFLARRRKGTRLAGRLRLREGRLEASGYARICGVARFHVPAPLYACCFLIVSFRAELIGDHVSRRRHSVLSHSSVRSALLRTITVSKGSSALRVPHLTQA